MVKQKRIGDEHQPDCSMRSSQSIDNGLEALHLRFKRAWKEASYISLVANFIALAAATKPVSQVSRVAEMRPCG